MAKGMNSKSPSNDKRCIFWQLFEQYFSIFFLFLFLFFAIKIAQFFPRSIELDENFSLRGKFESRDFGACNFHILEKDKEGNEGRYYRINDGIFIDNDLSINKINTGVTIRVKMICIEYLIFVVTENIQLLLVKVILIFVQTGSHNFVYSFIFILSY